MRRQRGFVLLVVLVVLTLAATLLVMVGQLAVTQARSSVLAENDVQRQWAQRSVAAALLPQAATLLAQAESALERPVPRIEQAVRLGKLTVAVSICDEQAKANINQMLERGDDRGVSDRLRAAAAGSDAASRIHLRPLPDPPVEPDRLGPPRVISSFGQIIESPGPEELWDPRGVASRVTCWSTGAINLLRAEPAAMELALSPTLTRIEIARIVEVRNRRWRGTTAGSGTTSLLDAAKISPQERSRLAVTAASSCHSVWILVNDGRRVWYNWHVSDESMAQRPLRGQFSW